MKRLRSCIARKSIRKHIFFTRRSHSGARPLSVGANDLAISSYVVSGSLFAVISDQRLMISVPQMTQDARRQVADEFGCCEYSANFASVLFLGSLEFPAGKPANEGADTSFYVYEERVCERATSEEAIHQNDGGKDYF